MNTDTKYNGWTNHATWLVALHINNDAYLQEAAREAAFLGASEVGITECDAADALRNLVEEWMDGMRGGSQSDSLNLLATDLIQGYLAEVNWQEIAANMLETVQS